MQHVDQHYVPKFLLRQWHARADGKLTQFQWQRGRLEAHPYAAKSVAKQLHLYSRMRDTATPDVAVERDFLGPHVDDPASLAHKAILSTGVRALDPGQKLAWAAFIVSLLLRTPSMMATLRERGRAILEAGVKADPDESRAIRGDAPEETLLEWVRAHRPWELEDLGVRTLPLLVHSEKLIAAVANGVWATRRLVGDVDFLIGDKPLIYRGRMDTGYLLALPVAPTKIFFACDSATWRNIADKSERRLVRAANRATVSNADRYVYSTGAQHAPLVRKYLRKP